MSPAEHVTLTIGSTVIDVYPANTLIHFPDGRSVAGAPEDTAAYRATAAQYGYGDDTVGLCIDHEIMHVALAHWLGLAESPTMRAVRYDRLDEDQGLRALEEAAVLAIQHYARAIGLDLPRLFTAATDP